MAARLSFSTLGCADRSLDEVAALAKAHGIGTIELRGLGGTLDLPDYLGALFQTPAGLTEFVADTAISIVALDSSIDIIGAGSAERRALAELLPWARAAAVPAIRVFDGGQTGSDDELASIGPTLDWWRDQTGDGDAQPTLMIETHDTLCHPPALQRFRILRPDAAILWDTHHTRRKGGEDVAATWPRIRSVCRHIHVKDSRTDASGKPVLVAPGDGEFPHADLIATLGRQFAGVVSLEWERYWHPDLAQIETALAKFIQIYGHLNDAPETAQGDPNA